MKKILIGFLILFVFTITKVNALSCGYEERAKLNNEVKNIKVNYEVKEKELPKGSYTVPDEYIGKDYVAKTDYFQINILNLTENVVVKVTNDINNDVITIKYSDTTDGNYSFDWENISYIAKLNFEVITSSETGCKDESIKDITLQLPRYNTFSESSICQEMPDYNLCQRYVTFDNIDSVNFYNNIEKENKKRQEENNTINKSWFDNLKDFFKKNGSIFLVSGGVIIVLVGGTIIYIKKRRGRDEV